MCQEGPSASNLLGDNFQEQSKKLEGTKHSLTTSANRSFLGKRWRQQQGPAVVSQVQSQSGEPISTGLSSELQVPVQRTTTTSQQQLQQGSNRELLTCPIYCSKCIYENAILIYALLAAYSYLLTLFGDHFHD